MSLKNKIESLVASLTGEIVDLIKSASVSELSEIGNRTRQEFRPAPAQKPVKARAAASAKSASNGSVKHANGKSNGSGRQGSQRRTKGEMETLRGSILKFLSGAKEPVKSSEIAQGVGEKTASNMVFPLRQLVSAKFIKQKGERGQARYSILALGEEQVGAS